MVFAQGQGGGGRFRPLDRPYAVAEALADYRADYIRRGGKAADRLDWSAAAWMGPELGGVELAKLTKGRIVAWHQKIAETPARLRSKPGSARKPECRRQPRGRAPAALDRKPGTDNPQGRSQPRAPRGQMGER